MVDNCTKIKNHTNRIKGQLNGISKMIDDGRDATEIVQQISAVRAALSRLAIEILKDESNACFNKNSKEQTVHKFEELVSNFFKIT